MKGNDIIMNEFADRLRVEGVKCKGYGIIPKFVMLDTDLSITAKGIYAYFCSYAGSGNTAFPCRDKIVADLQTNKDTYYKHFKTITDQGYITVAQANSGGRGNGFTRNIYTLVSSPEKFKNVVDGNFLEPTYAQIRCEGLESVGFGFIPKAVMLDSRLPIEAKAIYAYFCGFAGGGNSAFPKQADILHHLQTSTKTYYKYFNLLLETNYITPVQRHIGGRMSVNDYYLNAKPDIDAVSQKAATATSVQLGKFSDTQKQDTEIQLGKFSDTQISDTQISDTQKQDAQKQDAQKQDAQKQDAQISDTNNNNKSNNKRTNNNNNNNSVGKKQSIHQQGCADEGLNDGDLISCVKKELKDAGTLPREYLHDVDKLTIAIRIITEWDRRYVRPNEENLSVGLTGTEFNNCAFNLFVEALIEMLTASEKKMRLRDSTVSYKNVYERILMYLKVAESIDEKGEKYPTLINLEDVALHGYSEGCSESEIKNHMQYMKACIWTALQTGDSWVYADIKQRFG